MNTLLTKAIKVDIKDFDSSGERYFKVNSDVQFFFKNSVVMLAKYNIDNFYYSIFKKNKLHESLYEKWFKNLFINVSLCD